MKTIRKRKNIIRHRQTVVLAARIKFTLYLPALSTTKRIPVHQHRHSNFEPQRLIILLSLILSQKYLFYCFMFTSNKQRPINETTRCHYRLSASTVCTQRSQKSNVLSSVVSVNEPCSFTTRRLHYLTRLVWSNIARGVSVDQFH